MEFGRLITIKKRQLRSNKNKDYLIKIAMKTKVFCIETPLNEKKHKTKNVNYSKQFNVKTSSFLNC